MSDSIDRQAAIDALDEEPYVWNDTPEELEVWNMWHRHKDALMSLPSAQPEPCKDAVSREAVSEWLKQYGQDVLHGKYKFSLMYIWKNLMDLPSVQPEIIRCGQCKYAEVADQEDSQDGYICQFHRGSIWFSGSFCSWAERREE